jgi:porphobilinogen synthase
VLSFKYKLNHRLRRLRRTAAIRDLVQEVHIRVDDLICPLFVVDGNGTTSAIDSMPGQFRYCIDDLVAECQALVELGIKGIALFPVLQFGIKDEMASEALNHNTLILRAVRKVKATVPTLTIFTDIALDPYTNHGHDGILNTQGSDIDNDRTVEILAKMAVLHAEAGVEFVAPSDMMDGRVRAIREALDHACFEQTGIISYSAKFASCYYGPFREAVQSSQITTSSLSNKKTYQLNSANRKEALMECVLDQDEGADVLMVKPANMYLDIIRELRNRTLLPVAAYQVSGEYAQIHAAARLGWLDMERARDESLIAIKRAGADIILTYFAKDFAKSLKR